MKTVMCIAKYHLYINKLSVHSRQQATEFNIIFFPPLATLGSRAEFYRPLVCFHWSDSKTIKIEHNGICLWTFSLQAPSVCFCKPPVLYRRGFELLQANEEQPCLRLQRFCSSSPTRYSSSIVRDSSEKRRRA